jgi:hypothetical protein
VRKAPFLQRFAGGAMPRFNIRQHFDGGGDPARQAHD